MRKFLAAVKLILTLKCEQSTQIVSDSLDRDLSAVERWAVRLHYISCWSCRRFGAQVKKMQALLRTHPDRTTDDQRLSDEALKRIQTAIQRDS